MSDTTQAAALALADDIERSAKGTADEPDGHVCMSGDYAREIARLLRAGEEMARALRQYPLTCYANVAQKPTCESGGATSLCNGCRSRRALAAWRGKGERVAAEKVP